MTVRGLALDLDGTLLRPDDSISDRDRAAIGAAREAGWPVVLATARWYQLAERTAHALGLEDPVIACSGAEVRRLRDGVDLLDVRLPPAFTTELYATCTEGLVMVYGERDVALYGAPGAPGLPEMRVIDSFADAEPAPRGVLVFGEVASHHVLGELAARWADDVRFLMSLDRRGGAILTITATGADKGRALQVAFADLGIDASEVAAIGDSETDIEMFRIAGTSVAMGQASADVRQAATFVTTANTDDGVGRAIERLLAAANGSASEER